MVLILCIDGMSRVKHDHFLMLCRLCAETMLNGLSSITTVLVVDFLDVHQAISTICVTFSEVLRFTGLC